MLNYYEYKKEKNKLHYDGWKMGYFKYSGDSMIGCGCGVFHYPQFYGQK